MNSFQEYYLSVFIDKYSKFDGRAKRCEFWIYTLYNAGIVILLYILDLIAFRGRYCVFLSIYAMIKFIPELALSVRRLHDIDKSGYHLLWGLIPIIGSVYLIVLFCRDSTSGTNKYGSATVTAPFPQSTQLPSQQHQKVSSHINGSTGPADIRNKWGKTSSPKSPASSPSFKSNDIADGIRRRW